MKSLDATPDAFVLNPASLRALFQRAQPFDAYVAGGTPDQQSAWRAFELSARQNAPMSDAQRALVASFTRRINVLVLSGTWCGDCVQQCPLLHHIAQCNPAVGAAGSIDLRFIDRDDARELSESMQVCGGRRVPLAFMLNEDFEFVSLMGDKTLSRLRAAAARQLGASCPLPGAPVPADEVAATRADWLAEIERVHLLLRLSPKLRSRHQD